MQGKFPSELILAQKTPVVKSDDRSEVANYRLTKQWLTPDIMILSQKKKRYSYKSVKQNAILYGV